MVKQIGNGLRAAGTGANVFNRFVRGVGMAVLKRHSVRGFSARLRGTLEDRVDTRRKFRND